MSEYTLEIKQIVDYPRCRIYRQFVQALIADRSIRVSGGSGLFYFVVLCSYANFRTSYKRIDGISYTIYPGEWIMSVEELSRYFRTRFRRQTLAALEGLQKKGLISFLVLGHGKLVKFKIRGWRRHNTILDYNAPCQKDTGFFFFPVSTATELVSAGHCSEMDAVLDLWLNTVYNVQTSGRWSISATVQAAHWSATRNWHPAGASLRQLPADTSSAWLNGAICNWQHSPAHMAPRSIYRTTSPPCSRSLTSWWTRKRLP